MDYVRGGTVSGHGPFGLGYALFQFTQLLSETSGDFAEAEQPTRAPVARSMSNVRSKLVVFIFFLYLDLD